ncbi:MAG: hypothetical protein KBE91_04700 [Bacteroidia bacterium]|nr:hypothetical protein [Bacteroidia bacterium]
MNESNQKQKVVSILLDANKKKAKAELIEYPEINTLLDEGMYIESFNQCRLTSKKVCLTFVLRYYH